MLKERLAAFGANFVGGLIPRHKVTLGIIRATEEGIALLGFLFNNLAAADGTFCIYSRDNPDTRGNVRNGPSL